MTAPAALSDQLDLPFDTLKVLEAIANAGILGATCEEVAAYLITRGIDDLLRSGCVTLG